MNDLLARLSQQGMPARAEEPRAVALKALARWCARRRAARQHPVRRSKVGGRYPRARRSRCTAGTGARPSAPERDRRQSRRRAGAAARRARLRTRRRSIEVIDGGAGMSAEFIRTRPVRAVRLHQARAASGSARSRRARSSPRWADGWRWRARRAPAPASPSCCRSPCEPSAARPRTVTLQEDRLMATPIPRSARAC